MNIGGWPRLWFGTQLPVSRRQYAASGCGLALFKYGVEAAAIQAVTGRWLGPLDFLNPSLAARSEVLAGAPDWLGWALFAWNLPFVWIALSMSVRRASLAGVSPWTGLAVLVPVAGLVAMLALCLAPDRTPERWRPVTGVVADGDPGGSAAGALRALGAALAVGVAMLVVTVYLIATYGVALFLGTPLVMGAVAGFLFNRPLSRSRALTTGLGAVVMVAAAVIMLAFALEGLICIAMAAPIVMPLGIVGALLGKAVADATSISPGGVVPLVIALPLLAGAEHLTTRRLPEHVVLTSVDVAAPPERVWPHVVSFPDLPEPREWFFRCGIACPVRARIEGTGHGAVRHCEFTTGDFVEPITVWDEPRRLAFDVTSQPDPMRELSPWRHVHPPHLADHALTSRRGEFRLVDLGDGRTRLEGRTWYTFDMHPRAYWTLWSDMAIHAIHRRVLDHVRRLAEGAHRDAGAAADTGPAARD